jgi:DNA polymerase-1
MQYPSLKDQSIISLDIETYDPLLKEKGAGVYRKDGNILGVSLTTPDGFSQYFNIGHKRVDKEVKQKNLRYLKEQLSHNQKKLGANILYDLDWLENGYGVKVNGEIHDILYAEPLINEHQRNYNLDSLGLKYLNIGKKKSELEQWCEDNQLKGDARKWLYMAPYKMVENYALADTQLPLQIFKMQWDILKEQNLLPIYHLEIGLLPLLLQMRKQGVRVDQQQALKDKAKFQQLLEDMEKDLYTEYGQFSVNSTKQIAPIFDKLGIEYPSTDKGNPSITAAFLESQEKTHPFCGKIVKIKRMKRMVSAVIENVILDPEVAIRGRIHCGFHPLKSDDKGTVTGRFSSTKPNLQQIPARDEKFGKECRRWFIPEEDCYWVKSDYSQIEYRVLAHYAQGKRSEELREKYNMDPSTDYHKTVMNWTGLDRKPAKTVNFGSMYGMGKQTFANNFGWPIEKTEEILDLYHHEMPYVKTTMSNVVNVSRGRGFIKTILGRRSRASEDIIKYNKYYIMFNKLIQGSAADVMKKGMVDAFKAGVFDVIHPHLTVHDELDNSVPKTKEGREAIQELQNCMEKCVELRVPIKADMELGNNWGDASEENYEKFIKGEL